MLVKQNLLKCSHFLSSSCKISSMSALFSVYVVIDDQWPGVLSGHFVLEPKEDLHGWLVTLVFDQP